MIYAARCLLVSITTGSITPDDSTLTLSLIKDSAASDQEIHSYDRSI